MHTYIEYIANRAATREVEALADYYGLGALVVAGELTYDVARDDLTSAFKARNLAVSTAKVYLSQAHSLAQLFDTFDAVEEYADVECDGSRSLKRIYDHVTRAAKGEVEVEGGEGETNADVETVATSQLEVVLAALPNLTPAERAQVVAACQALGVLAVAA